MPRVEKVTVSLPKALLDYVEYRRTLTGANRSETVAAMLWEVRRQTELRDREVRYRAAFATQPKTGDAHAFTSAAAAELFANAGDEWAEVAPSPTATEATLPALRRVTSPGGADGPTKAKVKGTKRASVARVPVGKAAKRASK